ncbi:MAG TPA: ABC transporter permease, partial [Phycisphaerales bacterium]|nr:ABC transporter permease [Phycisphaerales bacterium]
MLPSLHLALNNLSGKRGRTALIIGAVALASALIVAVSCAINTVQASMEIGLVRILGRADARIIHQFSGRFDEDVLERVRTWPEVDRATGRLAASVSLVHADRRQRDGSEMPLRAFATAVGVEYDVDATLTNLEIVEGRYPSAPNEVLLDRSAAAELG